MRRLMAVAVIAVAALLAGCTGANAYQSVDLQSNLDQATLDRYQSEWKALADAGQGGHMVELESSNWWPLGLILYHRDSSVTRMETPQGPVYHVKSGHGFAPLSLLYSVSTHATNSSGRKRRAGLGVAWSSCAATT